MSGNHKNNQTDRLEMLATAPPGLESLVEAELKHLKVADIRPQTGGVLFRGDLATMTRANLRLRVAGRILVRIASFPVTHLSQLEKISADLPFENYIPADKATPICVFATSRKSRIYHSKAAAERVANAIRARLGLDRQPGFAQGSPLRAGGVQSIQVHLSDDICTISADSSGAHLHMRGYKTHSTRAPLRENLAAAALAFCGWDGTESLLDPMCGSGTIPIEGALIASRTAPGASRDFAFLKWPCMDADIHIRETDRVRRYARPSSTSIIASDRDPHAIMAARNNAKSAGFSDAVEISEASIENLHLKPGPGLILCNPPYGKRLGNPGALRHTYRSLGALMQSSPNWRLGIITATSELAKAMGLTFERVSEPFPNGGTRVRIYCTRSSSV